MPSPDANTSDEYLGIRRSPASQPGLATNAAAPPTSATDHPPTTTSEEGLVNPRQRQPARAANALHSQTSHLPRPSVRSASGPVTGTRALGQHHHTPSTQQMQARGSVRNLVARFDQPGQGYDIGSSPSAARSTSAAIAATHAFNSNAQATSGLPEPRLNSARYQPTIGTKASSSKANGGEQDGAAAGLQRDIEQTRHKKKSSRSQSQAPGRRRPLLFGEIASPSPSSDLAHLNLNAYATSRNHASEESLHSPKPNYLHARTHSDVPSPRVAPADFGLPDAPTAFHQRSKSDQESPAAPVFASSIRGIMDPSAWRGLDERYARSRRESDMSDISDALPTRSHIPVRSPATPTSPKHTRERSSESVVRGSPSRYRNSPNHPQALQKARSAAPMIGRQHVDFASSAPAPGRLSHSPGLASGTPPIPGSFVVDEEGESEPRGRESLSSMHQPALARPSSSGRSSLSSEETITSKSQGHGTFYERAQGRPASDVLSQLSNAVYQGPIPVLTVNTADRATASDPDTLTGVTEFEDDSFDIRSFEEDSANAGVGGHSEALRGHEISEELPQTPDSRMEDAALNPARGVFSQLMDFRRQRSIQSLAPTATTSPDPDSGESATIQIFLQNPLTHPDQASRSPISPDSDTVLASTHYTPVVAAPDSAPGAATSPQSVSLQYTSEMSAAMDRIIDQYRLSGGHISPKMIDEFAHHLIPTAHTDSSARDAEETRHVLALAIQRMGTDATEMQEEQRKQNVPDAALDSPTLPETPTLPHHPATDNYTSPLTWARNVGYRPAARPSRVPTGTHDDGRLVTPAGSTALQEDLHGPSATHESEDHLLSPPVQGLPTSDSPSSEAMLALPEIKDTGGGLGLGLVPPLLRDTPTPKPRRAPPVPLPFNSYFRSVANPHVSSEAPTVPPPPPPAPAASATAPAAAASAAVKPEPSADERRLTQRRNVIRELVDTEYKYLTDMKIVADIYMATGSSSDAISDEDQSILFGNIPDIVAFALHLEESLKRAAQPVYSRSRDRRLDKAKADGPGRPSISNGMVGEASVHFSEPVSEERDRQTTIGKAFWEHTTRLETVYTTYMVNHHAANERQKLLKSRPTVSQWLSECHAYAKDLTDAWDLDSLLVKPTQRMLKYHMLLEQIVKSTPKDHPDYLMLQKAYTELKGVGERINDQKRRTELLESINNPSNKKRGFLTLGRVLDRRENKLRQQIGATEAAEDPEYLQVSEKYGGYFLKLQVVMRDFDQYRRRTRDFMTRFSSLMVTFEEMVDSGGLSPAAEIESKWRRAAMTIHEMGSIAWLDHEAAIQRHCIEPLVNVIKMNDKTQKWMSRRKKRLPSYAKHKTMTAKGDTPDRKTQEEYQQFQAFNENLKTELPKMYKLTENLISVCLRNFVDIQRLWHSTWKRKMMSVLDLDDNRAPKHMAQILEELTAEFHYQEPKLLEFSIVNGSFSNGHNLLSSSTSSTLDPLSSDSVSSRRNTGASQSGSFLTSPDIGQGSFSSPSSNSSGTTVVGSILAGDSGTRSSSSSGNAAPSYARNRGSSSVHNQRGDLAGFYGTASANRSTASTTASGASSSRTSVEQRPRPSSASNYYKTASGNYSLVGSSSVAPSPRNGVFNSALPLPDSPTQGNAPAFHPDSDDEEKVLFIAASLFEFRINNMKYEAGFPYLQYIPGEIFDVLGVKGELWLARNQDDTERHVGWIWEKHFAKVAHDL